MVASETAPNRLSRRTARPGQNITVTLRGTGATETGTLLAWGSRVLRLQTAQGWREVSHVSIDNVHTA